MNKVEVASAAFELADGEASRLAHTVIPNFYEDGHVSHPSLLSVMGLLRTSGYASLVLSEHIEAATAGGCAALIVASTLTALQTVGSDAAFRAVSVLGVAGGLAYGLRQRFAEKWYARHYKREYDRESWELRNYEQGEREEMIGLYTHKGLKRHDAEAVITTMSAYPDFFVGIMMAEELQLRAPQERRDERAARSAACYAVAAVLPALVATVVRMVLGERPTSVMGLDAAEVALRVVGVVELTALGYGRAAVSRLRKRVHTVESALLALACVALPYAVVLFDVTGPPL